MKKKDLICYAGAAVLMAVSAQGVSADELVSNEATTTEGNQVQAEKVPEVAVAEKSVAPVASNYAAPANVTVCSTCEQDHGFRKWNPICRESYRSIDD